MLKTSWRTKLVALLIAFSVTPLAVVTFWSYSAQEQTLRHATIEGLEALAEAKTQAIDQFTDIRLRDVEVIASLIAPRLIRLRAKKKAEKRGEGQQEQPAPQPLPDLKKGAAAGSNPPPASAPETAKAPEPPRRSRAHRGRKAAERHRHGATKDQPKGDAKDEHRSLHRRDLDQTLGLILWDQRDFEELLVIDLDGRVLASTFDGHVGRTAAGLEYFERGRKAAHVQPVFMSPITEKLTMVIATPIRDEHHREIGVLAARLNLQRFFRLINDSTGLGTSGETVVAKRIDEAVVFMAPTRHAADAALKRKIALGSDRARYLQEAARGQDGSGLHMDYRGERTLAAWRHVPALDWGLLVKIDYDEAMRSATDARRRMVTLALVVLALALLASMLASRALVRPLRELKEATDRISRGDLAVQLDIRSADEIGELAASFERMVAAIKFFREHARTVEESDDVVEPS